MRQSERQVMENERMGEKASKVKSTGREREKEGRNY